MDKHYTTKLIKLELRPKLADLATVGVYEEDIKQACNVLLAICRTQATATRIADALRKVATLQQNEGGK
jgi:hypothetical protein